MNFSPRRQAEEPEINLIPFIDVLLVILIFLMLTTTYHRLTELQVQLPAADVDTMKQRPREIVVSISSEGRYAVDRQVLEGRTVEALESALRGAAGGNKDAVVVISADSMAAHQSVIHAMDASRRAGLNRLSFAAQSSRDARPSR